MDCLDPPLVALPPLTKKWMCPLHASHAYRKMRRPKHKVRVVDVSLPRGFRTWGDIEIENDEESEEEREGHKILEDGFESDFSIDGTTYRLPEKGIKLDFLEKIHMYTISFHPRLIYQGEITAEVVGYVERSSCKPSDGRGKRIFPLSLNGSDSRSLVHGWKMCSGQLKSREETPNKTQSGSCSRLPSLTLHHLLAIPRLDRPRRIILVKSMVRVISSPTRRRSSCVRSRN